MVSQDRCPKTRKVRRIIYSIERVTDQQMSAVSVTAAARLKVEAMTVAKVKGTVSVTATARLKQ